MGVVSVSPDRPEAGEMYKLSTAAQCFDLKDPGYRWVETARRHKWSEQPYI